MKCWLIIVLLMYQTVLAKDEFNWDKPSKELLEQKICTMDSTADAMVVQKESVFEIIQQSDLYIHCVTKRRIKIFSENGLTNADVKEYYTNYENIKSIEAYCYGPNGSEKILDRGQIRDELIVKDKERDIKIHAKAFAIPGAVAGSVIDIFISSDVQYIQFPPVYRFQEDIPVAHARVSVIIPEFFTYIYTISNKELLKIDENKIEGINPKRLILTCDAQDIPAIQNEDFRPPLRNLATDLIFILDSFNNGWDRYDFAKDWATLLKYYPKKFNRVLNKSQKAAALADSLIKISDNRKTIIQEAYKIVRDRWANVNYGYVFSPSDNVDNLMKEEALTPEDKVVVLLAILKHAQIDGEVIWVCSDNSDYKPTTDLPFPLMFDYAIAYLSSESLYLDPGNLGTEIGLLDESLMKRMGCRPAANSDLIMTTPGSENIDGKIIDMKLNLSDSGEVTGSGQVTFYNQHAIDSRREFKRLNNQKKKEWLNEFLFRNYSGAIDSLKSAPDSVQSCDKFVVEYWLKIKEFEKPAEGDFELALYPGPSIDKTSIDEKPPRTYPICFASPKYSTVYNIDWQLNSNCKPVGDAKTRIRNDDGKITYTLMSDYDSLANKITVQRQYRVNQKLFPATYAGSFEEMRKKMKESDQATIMVQQQ